MTLAEVYVGAISEGYSGSLTVADGGVVTDEVGVVAPGGDGYAIVTGKGSRWNNLAGLSFGPAVPTNSYLDVTQGGEVDWGANGFGLYDTLRLDGSAILHGKTIYDGGQIDALAGAGDVGLSQGLDIAPNWLFPEQDLASVSAAKGVILTLAGTIAGNSASILRAGAGHITISHADNAYGETQIYGAAVEEAATGALGSGEVDFVGAPGGQSANQLHSQVRQRNCGLRSRR